MRFGYVVGHLVPLSLRSRGVTSPPPQTPKLGVPADQGIELSNIRLSMAAGSPPQATMRCMWFGLVVRHLVSLPSLRLLCCPYCLVALPNSLLR